MRTLRSAVCLLAWSAGVVACGIASAASREYEPIAGVSPQPIAEKAGVKGREDLEAFLDGVMAAHLKYTPLAGATLAVVKDGAALLVKGYGYADLEKRIPVDGEQSLFRPGSTSKLFTWTAVMQLVEQGKLDLDADVNGYIQNLKLPATFAQPITLRNLMTHTPGLEDGGVGYLFAKDEKHLVPLADALALHVPARVRPPTTDFGGDGTNASYSNWGTALAGHIVASVSGMPFDEYIEQNIFGPLGMSSSTFREPLPPALLPRMATGYRFKAGKLQAHGFEFVHSFGPAGSLTSSAADMARFMIAHLNEGALGANRILRAETAHLMQSRQFGANSHLNGSGLGFYETWINGRRLIGHAGDMLAFHTDLWLLTEDRLGVFVSYNSSNELAPYVARRDLMRAFMDRYYPAQLPQLLPPKDFKARAARYAGSYRANRHSYTKFEKAFALFGGTKVAPAADNTLMIVNLLLPGPTYWVEVAPSLFREVNSGEMLGFVEDGHGKVTHLINPFTFIASYKVAWHDTNELHYVILGFGLLCFVAAIVSAVRNRRADKTAPLVARRARRLAALLGLTQIAGIALLATAIAADIDQLIYELPRTLYVALAFPLLAIPLTAGVLYFAVQVWKARCWSRYGRIQYSVIALMSLAFLWSLNHWNLIGYRFG